MTRITVEYKGGESRLRPGEGIDYMLAMVDGVELYAEMEQDDADETATYDELKAAILAQAAENNIPAAALRFQYDE